MPCRQSDIHRPRPPNLIPAWRDKARLKTSGGDCYPWTRDVDVMLTGGCDDWIGTSGSWDLGPRGERSEVIIELV